MHLEQLEDRQLLAGAQLIGIQPNDGSLLQDGDIRNISPADLTFRFDQNQVIDAASLGSSTVTGGIQITRANLDGVFAPATVSSDFGTGAAGVMIEFSAARLGDDQNGITLSITKSDFGGPGLPGVSVIDRTINVSLNVNANNQTTALDLVNALSNSAEASNLISARIVRGSRSQNIAATAAANSSLVLAGANDIVIHPGYIGVGAEPALNEVIYRFAGQLPDDTYRIDVFGTGDAAEEHNGETLLGRRGYRAVSSWIWPRRLFPWCRNRSCDCPTAPCAGPQQDRRLFQQRRPERDHRPGPAVLSADLHQRHAGEYG